MDVEESCRPTVAAQRQDSALTRRSYSCSDLVGDRAATIGIGAKVVDLARTVALRMAEIVNSKNLFAEIVRMIAESRPPPLASTG